jgi:hypothetical protein
MTLKKLADKIRAKDQSKMMFFAMNKNEADELLKEIEDVPKLLADIRTLEEENARLRNRNPMKDTFVTTKGTQ